MLKVGIILKNGWLNLIKANTVRVYTEEKMMGFSYDGPGVIPKEGHASGTCVPAMQYFPLL